jgi:exodeoxyribonuclease VII small subunit
MPAPSPHPELTLEQAMSRLEDVVADIEQEGATLEVMVARYEEGMQLLKVCGRILETAQRRIEMVTRAANGEVTLTDFEANSSPEPMESRPAAAPTKRKSPASAPTPDASDEIRLF